MQDMAQENKYNIAWSSTLTVPVGVLVSLWGYVDPVTDRRPVQGVPQPRPVSAGVVSLHR